MTSLHSNFAAYADVLAYLDALGLFHMDLGLDRVARALKRFDLVRPSFRVVHVVGTNGKGSTSRMVADVARAHGLRTGLYSSPHFVTPRERVLVDGRMLSEQAWVTLSDEIIEATGRELTYFEFITILAVLAFSRAKVDLAIMEAGLGGRYDASTALCTDCTVLTPIGLDHTQILGETLGAIADDKAGALRRGVPVVSARQAPEAWAVIEDRASRIEAPLVVADDVSTLGGVHLAPGLAGPHQQDNARLALATWQVMTGQMELPFDLPKCQQAMSTTTFAGRFQRLPGSPELVLDGAHNPPALDALARTLEDQEIRPEAVIFACMQDKDLQTMGPQVLALTDGPILATGLPPVDRAMPAQALAQALGPRAQAVPTVRDALARVQGMAGPILICGSLYLLGEFFTLRPESLGFNGPDWSL